MADVILPQLKTCIGCKLGKPLHAFHKYKRSKDGVRARCKPCRAQEVAADRAANPGRYQEQHRKYYEKNREHVIARTSAYNQAHPEVVQRCIKNYVTNPENQSKLVETYKKYRAHSKDKRAEYRKTKQLDFLEYNRRYREENRERMVEYRREWSRNNPDSRKVAFHNRRARKLSAGRHTVEEIKRILAAQAYCCANCEESISAGDRHLDHWMPLYLGGSNTAENLQWLCVACNLGKGRTDPIEWLRRIGKASHWPKQN